MSRDYWKLEEDLCRCCHSEGTFQNLAGAYNFDEEEEIYFDMLRETLDVNITPVSGSLCAPTYTICDACITRLRDASSFKKQVIRCEQKFHDMYGGNFIKLAESDCKVEVKEEGPERDTENAEELSRVVEEFADSLDSTHADYHDEDDDVSSAKRLKQEGKKKAKKTPQKAKTKAKPKKPPKKSGRPRKIQEIKEEEATGDKDKTDDSSVKPVTSKLEQLLTQGRTCQDYLSFTLIEDDNAKKYVCRYCNMSCTDEVLIRHHVQTAHPQSNENNIVKVHNFMEVAPDFKISFDDMENYICDVCSKEYPNKNSLRYHINLYHRLRKCPDCDLNFTARNLRMHQHEAHDVQLPTCGICGYKSWIRAKVTTHQRKVHMNEKNVSCEQCGMKFFDRINLARHKIAHGADRKYECSFCHKKYPRLNTLKLHEKIHTKIKDKVCSVCGEGFVQKASLNYHMKKHHPEAR